MYYEETSGVSVTVVPSLIAKDSHQDGDIYLYSYNVEIKNNTAKDVCLKTRHWIIRDGLGREEHVVGEGVIGEQPTIKPGESFSYASGCPLHTPTGSMRGKYGIETDKGNEQIDIPLFFLRPDLPKDDASWIN